ncbi:ZIP family metal transporter [Fodinibius sediminis]|uniref:Zinc and cadmium transporter n=1 Tax=Fodinibius sediminis TaxID=1214077 RepID=A0A521F0K5_9BACT|nr:ZIP family metal transporter [Fodinibius sediminis]SMO89689.1 zinc and cadmium transporter [Fodinibius sediminis]
MEALWWIITTGLLMSAIAMVGSVTLILKEKTLRKIQTPLVAFAAGSLIGGAFLHIIPAGLTEYKEDSFFLWILTGFGLFFVLEQFLHWRHCQLDREDRRKPLTYLILIGDGLHNFIGGLAIGGTFLIDSKLGLMAWLAAAAHEIPQELGDFAVLVHGGWKKSAALLFNVLSGLTFLLGGIIAFFVSQQIDVDFLIPFAAGNFIYIGASDLVPEVNKHESLFFNFIHFLSFATGIFLMWIIKVIFGH